MQYKYTLRPRFVRREDNACRARTFSPPPRSVLGSDPVDYLITPRVLACMIAAPILNLMCFCMGEPTCNHGYAWAPDCAPARARLIALLHGCALCPLLHE